MTDKIVKIGTFNGSNMVNAFFQFEEFIELNEGEYLENFDQVSEITGNLVDN